jgi:hypothetical protein
MLATLRELELKTKCVTGFISEAVHTVFTFLECHDGMLLPAWMQKFPLMMIIIGDELLSSFFNLGHASIISHLLRISRREPKRIRRPAEYRILIPNFQVNDVVTQS